MGGGSNQEKPKRPRMANFWEWTGEDRDREHDFRCGIKAECIQTCNFSFIIDYMIGISNSFFSCVIAWMEEEEFPEVEGLVALSSSSQAVQMEEAVSGAVLVAAFVPGPLTTGTMTDASRSVRSSRLFYMFQQYSV